MLVATSGARAGVGLSKSIVSSANNYYTPTTRPNTSITPNPKGVPGMSGTVTTVATWGPLGCLGGPSGRWLAHSPHWPGAQ